MKAAGLFFLIVGAALPLRAQQAHGSLERAAEGGRDAAFDGRPQTYGDETALPDAPPLQKPQPAARRPAIPTLPPADHPATKPEPKKGQPWWTIALGVASIAGGAVAGFFLFGGPIGAVLGALLLPTIVGLVLGLINTLT